MPSPFRNHRTAAAVIAVAALAGAGGGAAVYGVVSGGGTTTQTITAAAATPVAASSDLSVGGVYARNRLGVVEVDVSSSSGGSGPFPFGGGGNGESRSQGSGFVYDTSGHVITNAHVVDGASSILVRFADGSSYKASLVGKDDSTDVAVLKIDAPASQLQPVTLGDSSAVAVGDGVVAIGAPFGLDETVTSGIVSAVGREIQAPDNSVIPDAIQTDAPINHGNSGGPLFDLHGDVIGITSQIESDSGGNDGVGFAVPSNTVKRVAAGLIANGKVAHAFLGVGVDSIPAPVAKQLGTAAGAAVTDVRSGSAAAHAGLKAATGSTTVGGTPYPTGGDVITALDGTRVTGADDLRALIDRHSPGDTVKLTVSRGGKSRTVTAKLGSRS